MATGTGVTGMELLVSDTGNGILLWQLVLELSVWNYWYLILVMEYFYGNWYWNYRYGITGN
jgi:hypothetical protein